MRGAAGGKSILLRPAPLLQRSVVLTAAAELEYVRLGSFSGSALSLRDALAARVALMDWDLLPYARRPRLFPARLQSVVEARAAGSGVPWTKTRGWTQALQRQALASGLGSRDRAILFIGSRLAFVLDGSVRYAIYGDRVGREGAAIRGRYASRFTPGWLERESAFLRGAFRIYLMGPSTADVLVQMYGIPPEKILVVGAGPNAPLTPPRVSEECRRLLFAGTEWGLKGGPELLAAFERVRRRLPHLELVCVGSRPNGNAPEGVRLVGRVPHDRMDTFYSEADALVHPSHQDAFPISLIEALYKGIPCIGTTVGNQQWIIADAGICIEPGRVDRLAAAIEALVREYPRFRQRALERGGHLRQRLRWEAVASAILDDFIDT